MYLIVTKIFQTSCVPVSYYSIGGKVKSTDNGDSRRRHNSKILKDPSVIRRVPSHFAVFLSLFLSNDLTLIVSATSLTYTVRHHQSAALAALYQIGSRHFPVCSSLISSRFRCFILRADGHRLHLLKLTEYITNNSHSRVCLCGVAITGLPV